MKPPFKKITSDRSRKPFHFYSQPLPVSTTDITTRDTDFLIVKKHSNKRVLRLKMRVGN